MKEQVRMFMSKENKIGGPLQVSRYTQNYLLAPLNEEQFPHSDQNPTMHERHMALKDFLSNRKILSPTWLKKVLQAEFARGAQTLSPA